MIMQLFLRKNIVFRFNLAIFILLCGYWIVTCLFFPTGECSDQNEEQDNKHCACKHCLSQPNISKWFDSHFNNAIHPLLSQKNINLSADTLKFWNNLQPYYVPPPFQVVMRKVFQLFPGEEQYMDSGRSRCRSCAVVGNSNNLLGSSYGPQIDDHDFVMRMNEAKTVGYEEDVGSRTTHHFMYPESAIDLESNTSLVLIPFKMRDFEWLISVVTDGSIKVTYRRVPERIQFNKKKVLFYNPAFLKYIQEQWTKTPKCPSTGILVLLFAVHICDEVSVYGYGADSKGLWKHYWEKVKGNTHLSKHSGKREEHILQMLHEVGKIKLSKGNILEAT
ncbi:hypothetical protein SKAU_G00020260 [Synaphobranchus kaupii]|uniref:CMP-N-acetylneuraminate-beta-galactosamide-alpha-2,3-sialyltransferase 2 n=1 Tax=Synaphobranchus kaupii TaxID=118154 RepID=A0A9Q1GCP6_SYNKA|nr:hypothetical protein SKAU_G00020260 [Synaphobranchus kaupii]